MDKDDESAGAVEQVPDEDAPDLPKPVDLTIADRGHEDGGLDLRRVRQPRRRLARPSPSWPRSRGRVRGERDRRSASDHWPRTCAARGELGASRRHGGVSRRGPARDHAHVHGDRRRSNGGTRFTARPTFACTGFALDPNDLHCTVRQKALDQGGFVYALRCERSEVAPDDDSEGVPGVDVDTLIGRAIIERTQGKRYVVRLDVPEWSTPPAGVRLFDERP